jgi:hypothetical protein
MSARASCDRAKDWTTSILADIASGSECKWDYGYDHSVEEHILAILISIASSTGSVCQENVEFFKSVVVGNMICEGKESKVNAQ